MSSTTTPATVQLNVGGTKYTVSKALIEQYPTTMLARLVSDTWQIDPAQEIFIDRDGDTFRYVLGYMRDLKVHLLKQASKDAVRLELAYFGFENVPNDAIKNSFSPSEAVEYFNMQKKRMKKHHNDTLLMIRSQVKALKTVEYHEIMAHYCFRQYCLDGSLTGIDVRSVADEPDDVDSSILCLNLCLKAYGLRCIHWRQVRCSVTLHRLHPMTVDLEVWKEQLTNPSS
jgi:BTB/POZ domain